MNDKIRLLKKIKKYLYCIDFLISYALFNLFYNLKININIVLLLIIVIVCNYHLYKFHKHFFDKLIKIEIKKEEKRQKALQYLKKRKKEGNF